MSPSFGLSRRGLFVSMPWFVVLACATGQREIAAPGDTIDQAFGRLRRSLRKHVDDKTRRKQALAKLDELTEVIAGFDDIAYEWRTTSHEAMVAGADRAALHEIADDINLRVREQLLRAVAIGHSLRESLHASEWLLVFPPGKGEATRGASP